jgi:hypothetical protein
MIVHGANRTVVAELGKLLACKIDSLAECAHSAWGEGQITCSQVPYFDETVVGAGRYPATIGREFDD